jgi:hypothetical protein
MGSARHSAFVLLQNFRRLRKFLRVETGARIAPYQNLTLVCHSEELATKNLVLTFLSWSKEVGKAQSKCFRESTLSFAEGFSMTQ